MKTSDPTEEVIRVANELFPDHEQNRNHAALLIQEMVSRMQLSPPQANEGKPQGFALEKGRHSPHDPDRLGFSWKDVSGNYQHVEWAVTDNHPLMIMANLHAMAKYIEEKYYESNQRK